MKENKDFLYLREKEWEKAEADRKVAEENRRYWSEILTSETLKRLWNQKETEYYLRGCKIKHITISEDTKEIRSIYEAGMWKYIETGNLKINRFSQNFIKCALYLITQKLEKYKVEKYVYTQALEKFDEKLEKMYIRVLIAEMNILLENNLLEGNNKKEKYDYYKRKVLEKEDYVDKIMEIYPGLYRAILDAINYFVKTMTYIIECFFEDYEEILSYFNLSEKNILKSVLIENGDTHNKGKSVSILCFQDGQKVVFKPRSGKNEKVFNDILNYILQKKGMQVQEWKILCKKEYHWCEFIERKECQSIEEIHSFYERVGILLFLAYLLGTSDLHAENLIANGKFPVLVDLENLVKQNVCKSWDEIEKLKQSVLFTGILPAYRWNKKGNGINLGILEFENSRQMPVKVPVIENPNTLDMYIAYKTPDIGEGQNIPYYRGEKINFIEYEEDIKQGFSEAYDIGMKFWKELYEILTVNMEGIRNRIIFEDTQRYIMLLTASFHPDLLLHASDREIYFHLIRNGRKEEYKEIVKEEVREMLQGDVPYFYQYMDEKKIRTENRYLSDTETIKTAKEIIYEKLIDLNDGDLELQIKLLELSLDIYRMNNNFWTIKKKTGKLADNKLDLIYKVNRKIEESCINTKEDIMWMNPKLIHDTWTAELMGMYIYDGIAGIFIFEHFLEESHIFKCNKELIGKLDEKMFTYTDNRLKKASSVEDINVGIFDGESSIIYAYLLVYNLTKKKKYLKYAKKHSLFLKRKMENDKKKDLLQGNAGAVFVYCLLYKVTKKEIYLKWGEKAAKYLLKDSIQNKDTISWIVEGERRALLGVAHGNAGIAWAFAQLYYYTKNTEYEEIVKKALIFENIHYDLDKRDWKDFRDLPEDSKGKEMAWCHGVGGIVLTRHNIERMCDNEEVKRICRIDIERNKEKIIEKTTRENKCLCHGTCGNREIVNTCYRKQSEKIEDIVSDIGVQEESQLGFMNGLSGIAYTCLREVIHSYPNIVNLELND